MGDITCALDDTGRSMERYHAIWPLGSGLVIVSVSRNARYAQRAERLALISSQDMSDPKGLLHYDASTILLG